MFYFHKYVAHWKIKLCTLKKFACQRSLLKHVNGYLIVCKKNLLNWFWITWWLITQTAMCIVPCVTSGFDYLYASLDITSTQVPMKNMQTKRMNCTMLRFVILTYSINIMHWSICKKPAFPGSLYQGGVSLVHCIIKGRHQGRHDLIVDAGACWNSAHIYCSL